MENDGAEFFKKDFGCSCKDNIIELYGCLVEINTLIIIYVVDCPCMN